MTPQQPNATPEQLFAAFLQAFRLLGSAFLQLTGRVDAIKQTIAELHPEVQNTLDERIRDAQSASQKEFEALQQMLEFLGSTAQGPVQ